MNLQKIKNQKVSKMLQEAKEKISSTHGEIDTKQAMIDEVASGKLLNPFRPDIGIEEINTWGKEYIEKTLSSRALSLKLLEIKRAEGVVESLANASERFENLGRDRELIGSDFTPGKLRRDEKKWLKEKMAEVYRDYLQATKELEKIKIDYGKEVAKAHQRGLIGERTAKAILSEINVKANLQSPPRDNMPPRKTSDQIGDFAFEVSHKATIVHGLADKLEHIKRWGEEAFFREKNGESIVPEEENLISIIERNGREIPTVTIDDYLLTMENIRRAKGEGVMEQSLNALNAMNGKEQGRNLDNQAKIGPRYGMKKEETIERAMKMAGYPSPSQKPSRDLKQTAEVAETEKISSPRMGR